MTKLPRRHAVVPPTPVAASQRRPRAGAATLAQAELCRGMAPEAVARLLRAGRRRTFPAGGVLLRQGDPSDALHVILRGRVRVECVAPGYATPLFLRELGVGEVVGEMGLLEGVPRSATVVALVRTTTLELGLGALALAAVEYPQVAAALVRTLSGRLRDLTERLEGASREQADREEAARLEGAQLATRALQHELANQLTLTVGYCELLADDPRLPDDVRETLQKAQAGAESAAETLQRSQRLRSIVTGSSPGLPPLLDPERSLE